MSEPYYQKGKGIQLKKWKPKYDRILDMMILNPGWPISKIAKEMGMTYQWIHSIVNSEMFKAKYDEQNTELRNRRNDHIINRTYDVVEKGLDAVESILKDDEAADTVKVNATQNMMKALGFGGPQNITQINNNQNNIDADNVQVVQTVNRDELLAAKERRDLEHQARVVKEVGDGES